MWLLALIILLLASIQDMRNKSIYLVYPLILIIMGAVNSSFNTASISLYSFLILSLILITISIISKQAFGMGDALMLAGVSLFCGIKGCIFVISTMCLFIWIAMIGIGAYKVFKSKGSVYNKMVSKSLPLIPFITSSFAVWGVFN